MSLEWASQCWSLISAGSAADGITYGYCAKMVISKLLGYLIILGSVIVKVPQILKFYRAGEARGVNINMYLLETVGYTITIAFNLRKGYPFSTYGENLFILVQNLVLIAQMKHYAKAINAQFFALIAVYSSFAFALFSGLMSDAQIGYAQMSTVLVFASSKVPQIITSYQNKSTGQLAFFTCFLNFAGVVARTFTIFAEVPDRILQVVCLSSLFFNGVVVLQFFLYPSGAAATAPAAGGAAAATTTDPAKSKKTE